MKNIIHKIITDLKFLYPCIAYEKSMHNKEDNILYITTETKASRLYPVVKIVKDMTNVGEDYWGRTTFFHEETNQYYCEVDGQLYFKGNDQEGEPHYPIKDKYIEYYMPALDSQLNKFEECKLKGQKYFYDNPNMSLLETEILLDKKREDISKSKIYCTYKIQLIK